MQTSRLRLQGLVCSGYSSVIIIERATKTLSSVSNCKVDLGAQRATLQYVSLEIIQQALTAVGYVAQMVDKALNLTA